MAGYTLHNEHEQDDRGKSRRSESEGVGIRGYADSLGRGPQEKAPLANRTLLSDPAIRQSRNSPVRAAVLSGRQQTVGNRAVQRSVRGHLPSPRLSVQRHCGLNHADPNTVYMMNAQGQIGNSYPKGQGPQSYSSGLGMDDFEPFSSISVAPGPAIVPGPRTVRAPLASVPIVSGGGGGGGRRPSMPSMPGLAARLGVATSAAPGGSTGLRLFSGGGGPAPAPEPAATAATAAASSNSSTRSAAPAAALSARPPQASYLSDVITPQQDYQQRKELQEKLRPSGPAEAPALVSTIGDVTSLVGAAGEDAVQSKVPAVNQVLRGQQPVPSSVTSTMEAVRNPRVQNVVGKAGAAAGVVKAAYEPSAPNVLDAGVGLASLVPAAAGVFGRALPAYNIASAGATAVNMAIGGFNYMTGREGDDRIPNVPTPAEIITAAPGAIANKVKAMQDDPEALEKFQMAQATFPFMG